MATDEHRREASKRATERARAVLKPGDRLRVTKCGGGQATVTFQRWEGDSIVTPARNDVHASHIVKLNGKPISFQDEANQQDWVNTLSARLSAAQRQVDLWQSRTKCAEIEVAETRRREQALLDILNGLSVLANGARANGIDEVPF